MTLQYANLFAQPPAEALKLLQKATANEIATLILQAKAARKPLLFRFLDELAGDSLGQVKELTACMNILLNHTQGNWDHDFTPEATGTSGCFARLYLLFREWDVPNRTIQPLARITYKLSPEIVIRELRSTAGGIFTPKMTLFTYLLNERPRTSPLLEAIENVLGQPEIANLVEIKVNHTMALLQLSNTYFRRRNNQVTPIEGAPPEYSSGDGAPKSNF